MQTQIRVWYGDITMQNGAYYDKFYKCSHCKGNLNFALSHIFKHIVYNPRKYRFPGRPKGYDSTSTLEIQSVHHLLLEIEMVIYFCFSNHRLIIISVTELF